MNGEPQRALLSADTDRTQDFVFESARLPEIRGASRQLDDLNAEIAELVESNWTLDNSGIESLGGLHLAKLRLKPTRLTLTAEHAENAEIF